MSSTRIQRDRGGERRVPAQAPHGELSRTLGADTPLQPLINPLVLTAGGIRAAGTLTFGVH